MRIDDAAASDAAVRGITTVAELRSRQRDACPVLRRPLRFEFPQDGLEVAVAFVVDTMGMVDPTTLQVVSQPGEPGLVTGLVPHIYAVGAKSQKDPTLRDAGPALGAILADDLVRHVAMLRFRPASRKRASHAFGRAGRVPGGAVRDRTPPAER